MSAPIRTLVWYWGRRGGGARYTLELARALGAQPSVEVHLSLSRQSELFAETSALGLSACHIDTYGGLASAALRSLTVMRVRRALAAYCRAHAIDVVLCSMRHLWGPWVGPALRGDGRRLLLTVHDVLPHPGDWHFGWHWMMRRDLEASDGLVLLSEHGRTQLLERHSYDLDRTWVIPHGPFTFSPNRPALRERPRRLLFFGRILPYKGLPLLLDAFERVAERLDLTLQVVGAGHVGAEAARMAGNPRIEVYNHWIPEAEIGAFFDNCDIVVLPYVEASQSGVAAAAHGMGLPIVATPVGGLVEQVRDGETGVLAHDISAEALADAIARLCADPGLYRRCSMAAAANIQPTAWTDIAARTAEVIAAIHDMPARR